MTSIGLRPPTTRNRLSRSRGLTDRVGRGLVGCSQNSLTTRFPALLRDLPQVKRTTSHSVPDDILGGPGLLVVFSVNAQEPVTNAPTTERPSKSSRPLSS